MNADEHHHVAIVGAGFGGLGIAHALQAKGIEDFVILERADDVGGVWRDNAYPGAACDVQSHLYSYSFAPNPSWSREFSPQGEILDYLRGCVTTFGIGDRLRLACEVTELTWADEQQHWQIETTSGSITADHVVMAAGVLSAPSIPQLSGADRFAGPQFHSSRWPADLQLAGRSVAVIGTGASAIQFVPAIQPEVGALTVFQRTAPWVMPRHDGAIGPRRKRLYARVPLLQRLERIRLAIQRESFILGFRHPMLMAASERKARRHLREQVRDPELRARLTPDYRLGCKRILLSNAYLRALDQDNADVITAGIAEIRERSIVDQQGIEHDVDIIIYGTGFHVADAPWAEIVRGREGDTLADAWNGSPKAYLGTAVAGFPNLSLIHGPNIGVGHTSVIELFETQFAHIAAGVAYAREHGIGALEPTREAQERFVATVDRQMRGTVWNAGGCTSWYLDTTGRNSALWPGSTIEFRLLARPFRPEHYAMRARSARKVPA